MLPAAGDCACTGTLYLVAAANAASRQLTLTAIFFHVRAMAPGAGPSGCRGKEPSPRGAVLQVDVAAGDTISGATGPAACGLSSPHTALRRAVWVQPTPISPSSCRALCAPHRLLPRPCPCQTHKQVLCRRAGHGHFGDCSHSAACRCCPGPVQHSRLQLHRLHQQLCAHTCAAHAAAGVVSTSLQRTCR